MSEVSVCISDEKILKESYYKVLKQDIINMSDEEKIFELAMFKWTTEHTSIL